MWYEHVMWTNVNDHVNYSSVSEKLSGCSLLLTVPLEDPVGTEEEILGFIKSLFGPEVQNHDSVI